MKTISIRQLTVITVQAAGLLMAARVASGVPISAKYLEDTRGDTLPNQSPRNEIGDNNLFPGSEVVAYHDHRFYGTAGVPNDGIANDWTVHLTNVSGQAWRDLFFVADLGATIGNADGKVEDMAGAGVYTDAFRIDATGSNVNLLFESISNDGIFQPGEDWEFAVMNFGTGLNSLPPALVSPGRFAGSSQVVGFTGTNSSIIASPVPEPGTGMMICMAALGVLLKRRRRV